MFFSLFHRHKMHLLALLGLFTKQNDRFPFLFVHCNTNPYPFILTRSLKKARLSAGADLGGGCRGCAPPPPEMMYGFLIQLVFCKKKTMWFIGVEVEQETSAPPPEKNPGSAPVQAEFPDIWHHREYPPGSPSLPDLNLHLINRTKLY